MVVLIKLCKIRYLRQTSPRKHLLVSKASSPRLQPNNITSSKTSWRRLQIPKIVTLKASSRRLEDMSRRRIEDIMETKKHLLGISVSKKSKCVSNKSLFHKSISDNSKATPKCINYNPIISLFVLFWNWSSISILRTKISLHWFGFVKSAEFKFEIAKKVRH